MNTSEIPTPLAGGHPYAADPPPAPEAPGRGEGAQGSAYGEAYEEAGPVETGGSTYGVAGRGGGEAQDGASAYGASEQGGETRGSAYGASGDGVPGGFGGSAGGDSWRSWFDADSRTAWSEDTRSRRTESDEMVSGDADEEPEKDTPVNDEHAGRPW